jgi:hypothetical protein
MRIVRSLLLGLAIGLSLLAGHVTSATAATGMVTGIANKQVSIAPYDDAIKHEDRSKSFTCNSDDVQKLLGRLPDAGDRVAYVDGDDKKSCSSLQQLEIHIGFLKRLLVVGLAAAAVLGAAIWATFGHPTHFLIGVDRRYSNSQCQLALWFGLAATMYVALVALRVHYLGPDFLDGVALTANVMTLSGLSALTFGAAKAVSAQKAETASNEAAPKIAAAAETAAQTAGVAPTIVAALKDAITKTGSDKAAAMASQVLTAASATAAVTTAVDTAVRATVKEFNPDRKADKPNLHRDLFQNSDGEVDLGDFQMILITVGAAIIWGVSCFTAMGTLAYQVHVTLPDVDTTLLAGFGIGQGAYLVKKAALPLGKG